MFALLGIFAGSALGMRLVLPRVGDADAYAVAIAGVLGGLIGSRVFQVIDAWSYYAAHPEQIVAVWNGGAAVTGGIVGGIVGGFAMARARELPIAHVLDRGVAGLALGMAIGRIGDVINGEHHATACAGVPWCVRYTSPSTLGQRDFVHPAVAYELVADLLILLAVLALLRRDPPPLVPMLAFVGLYGLVRLALSPFRLDPAWLGAITEAQAVSAAFVVIAAVGIPLLVRSRGPGGEAPRRVGGSVPQPHTPG